MDWRPSHQASRTSPAKRTSMMWRWRASRCSIYCRCAKFLKDWLDARRIGRLEIKKRGVDLDPEQLRRQLRVAGDNAATLIVTQVNGRRMVIAARRVAT